MHIDSKVSTPNCKRRLLVSHPRLEKPLSQDAEFGQIEKRCKATIGNDSGSGLVSIKFHQLIGSWNPWPNSKSNGGSFFLYQLNCEHNARDCSRSNPKFRPIDRAVLANLA